MKRHADLIHFSREHHVALSMAKRILDHAHSDHAAAMSDYGAALLAHFAAEEAQFAPLWIHVADTRLHTVFSEQHRHLRRLLADAATAAVRAEFARALREHVRFEERELFPVLESLLIMKEK